MINYKFVSPSNISEGSPVAKLYPLTLKCPSVSNYLPCKVGKAMHLPTLRCLRVASQAQSGETTCSRDPKDGIRCCLTSPGLRAHQAAKETCSCRALNEVSREEKGACPLNSFPGVARKYFLLPCTAFCPLGN